MNRFYVVERQKIDGGDVSVHYERVVGSYDLRTSPDRACILFTRGSSRLACQLHRQEQVETTSTRLLFVPAGKAVELSSRSMVTDIVIMGLSEKIINECIQENRLLPENVAVMRSKVTHKQRSRWMDDLVERYLFEKLRNDLSPKGCAFFLEKQIINELARLMFPDQVPTTGDMLGPQSGRDLVDSAIRHIDKNLFSDINIATLCDELKTTNPTLTKSFKDKFNTTPSQYLRNRRLDEAAMMLERGDYLVRDIALLVGYNDLAAFTRAFRERFNKTPSECVESR